MTKEEKIKESWGEKFDSDVNLYKGSKIVGFNYSYNSEEYDSIKYLNCIEIRPKSLKGIEDNNGWIKIENEEDLPKENGIYWILRENFVIPLCKEVFNDLDKDYWLNTFTHYQPIEKPKLPIY